MNSATQALPVLARLCAVVDELVALPLCPLADTVEADLLAELERGGRRLAFVGIRVIADMDSRNVVGEHAGISMQEFLRRRLRLSPSEAKSRIRAAAELVESVTPSGEALPAAFPETAAGVANGELSLDHARVVSRASRSCRLGWTRPPGPKHKRGWQRTRTRWIRLNCRWSRDVFTRFSIPTECSTPTGPADEN